MALFLVRASLSFFFLQNPWPQKFKAEKHRNLISFSPLNGSGVSLFPFPSSPTLLEPPLCGFFSNFAQRTLLPRPLRLPIFL